MNNINSSPHPKKYDWSKPWVDRFYVLNSLLADSFFVIGAFALVKGAELGIRALSSTMGECPEFDHLTFADILHYISIGLIGVIVCRFAVCLIGDFVIGPIIEMAKGLVKGAP